jgi:hypothetical protein
MRPNLVLALSLFTLALGACEAGSQATSQSGTQQATVGGQNVSAAAGVAIDIPAFLYQESMDLQASRVVSIFDSTGFAQRFEENLHSDGTGQIALSVENYADFGSAAWSVPSAQLLASYYDRQTYLLKYRDLHLGSSVSLHRNFRWTERPGLVQVAGIDCKSLHAHSVEGLGDFDFLVTADTNLLLGWTTFDVQGNPQMKLETTSVDFTPDHNGILWAVPAVAEAPYAGEIDDPKLGFTPSEPQYLPPGFYALQKRLLFANGVLAGLGNIQATLYTDGIHMLFIAQQKVLNPPAMTFISGASLVKFAKIGGIGVAEGDGPDKRVYVVSQLPTEELQTIFGSMF